MSSASAENGIAPTTPGRGTQLPPPFKLVAPNADMRDIPATFVVRSSSLLSYWKVHTAMHSSMLRIVFTLIINPLNSILIIAALLCRDHHRPTREAQAGQSPQAPHLQSLEMLATDHVLSSKVHLQLGLCSRAHVLLPGNASLHLRLLGVQNQHALACDGILLMRVQSHLPVQSMVRLQVEEALRTLPCSSGKHVIY